jgi:hypothetical protein
VRYGVYTPRERWIRLSGEEKQLMRDRAALLVCFPDAVLSHTSAARFLELPLYAADESSVHVTRLDSRRASRTQAGVTHHLASLTQAEVMQVEDVRVTVPERTVTDLARTFGFHTGLVAADAAIRLGTSRESMVTVADRLTTEPGAPAAAAAIQYADGRAQTPIETLGRLTLMNMGIRDFELQFVVRFSGGGHAECDIYVASLNHVFECDGRIKYADQVDRYGNVLTPDDVVWLEKAREDKIRGEGLGFSRLNWNDVQPDNFERTSRRLWREIEQQQGSRRPRTLPPSA